MDKNPNILLILSDDMGFSDIGCYGGEVQTPNLDSLAQNGLRYTQFYTNPRCCPSRATILTGLYPHQANIGHMIDGPDIDGYVGDLSMNAVTIAEVLRSEGYKTYMAGKWHVTKYLDGTRTCNWPYSRGFDDVFGTLTGCGNYFNPQRLVRNNEKIAADQGKYFTDCITDEAIRQVRLHHEKYSDQPFFQYVAYTAPHWPLHARSKDIQKYKGRFDEGWDILREKRMNRMKEMGIIKDEFDLSKRDETQPCWDDTLNKEWEARRMEVYAAQIDCMDQGIGLILEELKQTDQFNNTVIMFLSDNGGCAEIIAGSWKEFLIKLKIGTEKTCDGIEVKYGNYPQNMPGGEATYQSYGVAWANLSNTPFRLYKHWVHEGGISTPFIVHWPDGIKAKNELRHQMLQTVDIMATILDITDTCYPMQYEGRSIKPQEGFSFKDTFIDEPSMRNTLYFEHEGNKSVREGKWKLVCKYPGEWELYDMQSDRTETRNVIDDHMEIARSLIKKYEEWAKKCNILPWGEILDMRSKDKALETSEKWLKAYNEDN